MFKFREEAPKNEKKDAKLENEKESIWKRIGFLEYLRKVGTYGLVLATMAEAQVQYEKHTQYDFSFPESPELKTPDSDPATGFHNLPEVVIYGHTDPETDAVLNMLTGKEDLPTSYKFELIKKNCIHVLELDRDFSNDTTADKEIDILRTMSLEEYEKKYGIKVDDIFGSLQEDFNLARYETIWQLHQKNGNPEIELVDFSDDEARQSLAKSNGVTNVHEMAAWSRAYYTPGDNTLHLMWSKSGTATSVGDMLHDWVAELSHAKQYEEKPWYTAQSNKLAGLRIALNQRSHDEDAYTAQLREYNIKGSQEYEAHKVIEPKLKEILTKSILEEQTKLYEIAKKSGDFNEQYAAMEGMATQFLRLENLKGTFEFLYGGEEKVSQERNVKRGHTYVIFVFDGEVRFLAGDEERIIKEGERVEISPQSDQVYTFEKRGVSDCAFVIGYRE